MPNFDNNVRGAIVAGLVIFGGQMVLERVAQWLDGKLEKALRSLSREEALKIVGQHVAMEAMQERLAASQVRPINKPQSKPEKDEDEELIRGLKFQKVPTGQQ